MPFDYQTPFPESPPDWKSSFNATFSHTDWVDGQDLVQAGDTETTIGFNTKFHQIQADIKSLGDNVAFLFTVLLTTRHELRLLLDEIKAEFNNLPQPKTGKDSKEGKETKEGKESKEGKEAKEKDTKEGKDTKEAKDHKDGKESKEKEKEGKEVAFREKSVMSAIEQVPVAPSALAGGEDDDASDADDEDGVRPFITSDERPVVGSNLYREH